MPLLTCFLYLTSHFLSPFPSTPPLPLPFLSSCRTSVSRSSPCLERFLKCQLARRLRTVLFRRHHPRLQSPSLLSYLNKPLVCECTVSDTHVLECHSQLLHATDIDGLIMINSSSPVHRDASLFMHDYLLTFNARYSATNRDVIASSDNGDQSQAAALTLFT